MLPRHSCRSTSQRRTVLLVALRTLAIFGFAAWVYIALVALVHPETLVVQLTHFSKWPHEDTFGEISFVVSVVSFFLHSLLCDSAPRHRPKDEPS
jgi:hypothetical protein